MRATLRLPALIVTADGPRNGKDSSSRIRNPIGERRLLSNPVPRVCVGYEGPCIAPRKRQLLHEHHPLYNCASHRQRRTALLANRRASKPTADIPITYETTVLPRPDTAGNQRRCRGYGSHPSPVTGIAPTSCPARTRCRNGKFPERQRRRPGTPMPRRHPIVLVEGDDLVARKTTSSSVA